MMMMLEREAETQKNTTQANAPTSIFLALAHAIPSLLLHCHPCTARVTMLWWSEGFWNLDNVTSHSASSFFWVDSFVSFLFLSQGV